jgi:exodeoxyribonuclease V alpha subunit
MLFLHANGVGTSRAVRIYKTYGNDAVRVISENPYRLARDIRGIGFRTADQIAAKVGIEKTALVRVRAGISYALAEAMNEGHCGLPRAELTALTGKLLEVPEPLIETALESELEAGEVVADQIEDRHCVFLAGLYRAEQTIAGRLRLLVSGAPSWPPIDAARAIPWVERRTGMQLAKSQCEAVRLALASKALVITGGPGVGKTTLVNSILKIVIAKQVRVALCAPTGRAAKRLSESTGLEAKTIHRLLETDPRTGEFRRTEEHPLDCDLLVVDEASMIDVLLMRSLLRAVPDDSGLLIIGDVDQLPSVGQVLADITAANLLPVVRLTEVFRQAAGSRVITNAHRINRGQMPELTNGNTPSDFYFIDAEQPEDGVAKIVAVVRDRMPKAFGLNPIRDVQVLCPMNRGGLGARSLNIELQKALNPPGEARVERFGWTYGPGDKVMQVENDYDREVYNGDLGIVQRVDDEEAELVVTFDGRDVRYGFGELDELVLAYATTIHKSQGSEYPAVVIPLVTQHYMMLARNLLYTGVTRGKRLVVPGRPAKGTGDRGPQRGFTTALVQTTRSSYQPYNTKDCNQKARQRVIILLMPFGCRAMSQKVSAGDHALTRDQSRCRRHQNCGKSREIVQFGDEVIAKAIFIGVAVPVDPSHPKAVCQCRLAVPGITRDKQRSSRRDAQLCLDQAIYRWCWLEGAGLLNTDDGIEQRGDTGSLASCHQHLRRPIREG